ncbi:hypothetical protein [Streptomyces sp. NBRC 110035]|uniref:hypothetical protein n=1 Tax=Streptomyces sp. NBRC 110035 TaxID=1547867 RepID=UPI0022773711|nr:hypothetical protein [Streptomyces sp. NBRC 110035]
MAVGGADGDGCADLAVRAHGEDVDAQRNTGSVLLLEGRGKREEGKACLRRAPYSSPRTPRTPRPPRPPRPPRTPRMPRAYPAWSRTAPPRAATGSAGPSSSWTPPVTAGRSW